MDIIIVIAIILIAITFIYWNFFQNRKKEKADYSNLKENYKIAIWKQKKSEIEETGLELVRNRNFGLKDLKAIEQDLNRYFEDELPKLRGALVEKKSDWNLTERNEKSTFRGLFSEE